MSRLLCFVIFLSIIYLIAPERGVASRGLSLKGFTKNALAEGYYENRGSAAAAGLGRVSWESIAHPLSVFFWGRSKYCFRIRTCINIYKNSQNLRTPKVPYFGPLFNRFPLSIGQKSSNFSRLRRANFPGSVLTFTKNLRIFSRSVLT